MSLTGRSVKWVKEAIIQYNDTPSGGHLAISWEPLVRCKDCKHRGNSEKCVLSAISKEKDFPLFMLDNRGEWFCADGERKD